MTPRARVTLTRADTTATAAVEAEPDGRLRMVGIPAGTYAITVSGTAFAPLRAAIRLTAGQTLDLPLGLTIRGVNAEVTVNGVLTTADVPQRVNVITRDEIAARQRPVLVDLLAEEPGVDIQRTGPSMGGGGMAGDGTQRRFH